MSSINPPVITLAVLLTVLFVAFKLAGVIAWSWLWVLSPLWILFGALFAIFLLVALFAVLARDK